MINKNNQNSKITLCQVKVDIYESEFNQLKNISTNLDTTIKNLTNKCIKLALIDYDEKKYIRCNNILDIKDDKLTILNTKIYQCTYDRLKNICELYKINIKTLIRLIVPHYSNIVKDIEDELYN